MECSLFLLTELKQNILLENLSHIQPPENTIPSTKSCSISQAAVLSDSISDLLVSIFLCIQERWRPKMKMQKCEGLTEWKSVLVLFKNYDLKLFCHVGWELCFGDLHVFEVWKKMSKLQRRRKHIWKDLQISKIELELTPLCIRFDAQDLMTWRTILLKN